jgi:hypothetical protein
MLELEFHELGYPFTSSGTKGYIQLPDLDLSGREVRLHTRGCGTTATVDCTPHVGPGGSVRVDALIWKVTSVRLAKTLGKANARGRFVVVGLKVRSVKDEPAILNDLVFSLEVSSKRYGPDDAGNHAFSYKEIDADSTVAGKIVFDVPTEVLTKKVEMRFGELVLGSTHGYIRLPSLNSQ